MKTSRFRLRKSSARPLPHLCVAAILSLPALATAQTVRSSSGTNAAAITPVVTQFRTDLGTLNLNVPGSFGSGRREINWDGVPDAFSAPNNLPANFFNVNSPRGAVFSTPGTGFQVSANSTNPTSTPVEFGNIDPNYPTLFATFSAQRLFTPLGSNVTDVFFFVPGSTTPALVTGFGAVFTDVDVPNLSSITIFDLNNNSLGTFFAPSVGNDVNPVNESFSFLGVFFNNPTISHVRITDGNQVLAPGNLSSDLVVLDDFIYGEPNAVPEPATTALLGAGILALAARWLVRRRRQHC